MEKGFLAALFDYSFSSLITPKIIRVVYIIITIVVGLISLAFFANLASQGGGGAVAGLIFAPAGFLLYMILARIYLEIVIIIFRIGDDVRRIADRQDGLGGGGAGRPPTVI